MSFLELFGSKSNLLLAAFADESACRIFLWVMGVSINTVQSASVIGTVNTQYLSKQDCSTIYIRE